MMGPVLMRAVLWLLFLVLGSKLERMLELVDLQLLVVVMWVLMWAVLQLPALGLEMVSILPVAVLTGFQFPGLERQIRPQFPEFEQPFLQRVRPRFFRLKS
ncbi:MAG: hypothetical protein HY877_03680 [Deltaproteobacteria bacterium]|nr:hypothetical protein [Deltaproteobacteria bacterium]